MSGQRTNVLEYLDETAARLPDKTAFIDDTEALTFGELLDLCHRAGSALIGLHVEKEPVPICMGRHPHMIAAMLAVIAAGGICVPLDPEMPAMRIRQITESCRAKRILCDRASEDAARGILPDGEIFVWEDLILSKIDEKALALRRSLAVDTDPFYIVFTSGSTGIPKGVCGCHRAVIDYTEALGDALGFDGDTVFGCQSPLYYDACFKEIWSTLRFGASTRLLPQGLFSWPLQLVQALNDGKINTICWVASALTMISAFKTFDTLRPEYLRTVAFGSEVFPAKQLAIWRSALPETAFYQLYGPTECTGMSFFHICDRAYEDGEPIPIGRPFRNTSAFLLKEDGTPALPGEEGEICLKGSCLALGYYNDPERTAQVFVQNPLHDHFPERVYRTGDMGRIDGNGDYVFVGRKDRQIKHMGHRIEPGEIEAAAARTEGVILAACTFDNDRHRLVLWYTGSAEEKQVAESLKKALPVYMMPAGIQRLSEMPRTATGKIDRKRLT